MRESVILHGNRPATRIPVYTSYAQGFSLVELMITVAIMAIFMALAVPSFDRITLRSKLRANTNAFAQSIVQARSEAIKRNAPVTMCVSADGVSCIAGGWEQGWIVFADTDNSNAIDGAEVLLLRQDAANAANLVPGDPRYFLMTEAGGISELNFPAAGVGVQPATLTICRSNPAGAEERVVSVTASARTTVTKTTNAACP